MFARGKELSHEHLTRRSYEQPALRLQDPLSVPRGPGEIEQVPRRYGADQFFYRWEGGRGIMGFRVNQFQVRLVLPLLLLEEFHFYQQNAAHGGTRQRERNPEAQ